MNELKREDYEEPRCLLNMHPEIIRIPTGRVIEKVDEYLGKNDYVSAERHLKYWLTEAEGCNDNRGRLTVLNELIGLYRKTAKKTECLDIIDKTLELIARDEFADTVTVGTTYINIATGCKAFDKVNEALPLYEKAREIYEKNLDKNDERLAGLYNNHALALIAVKEYEKAKELLLSAIDIMNKQENGEADAAISYLNLADLIMAEKGAEEGAVEIDTYVVKAQELLETPTLPRDGYYAFVCEKCAPVFGYYGYFAFEEELKKRMRDIYEGT